MDNFQLIEALSNTSTFDEIKAKGLLCKLINNLNLADRSVEHLEIRNKLSARHQFPDAQADFTYYNASFS